MAAAAPREIRFVAARLRLFDAMTFDAHAMHSEAVARGDAAALPMPVAVAARGRRVEIVASRTVHVTHVAVRNTRVSFFGEAIGDL
jgi:hypothetical protein